VEVVRTRFGKERVVLLGHSWGSALGILYTARHPEKVAAYMGIGQVVDMAEGERLSYDFARTEATRRQYRRALKTLHRIRPPPHTVDEMLTSRKWVERFGGAFHGNLSTGKLIWAALRTDEANLVDLIKFGQGNRFSLRHLWSEFPEFKVDGTLSMAKFGLELHPEKTRLIEFGRFAAERRTTRGEGVLKPSTFSVLPTSVRPAGQRAPSRSSASRSA